MVAPRHGATLPEVSPRIKPGTRLHQAGCRWRVEKLETLDADLPNSVVDKLLSEPLQATAWR
jgi:hypothetical protein